VFLLWLPRLRCSQKCSVPGAKRRTCFAFRFIHRQGTLSGSYKFDLSRSGTRQFHNQKPACSVGVTPLGIGSSGSRQKVQPHRRGVHCAGIDATSASSYLSVYYVKAPGLRQELITIDKSISFIDRNVPSEFVGPAGSKRGRPETWVLLPVNLSTHFRTNAGPTSIGVRKDFSCTPVCRSVLVPFAQVTGCDLAQFLRLQTATWTR
jgi:hypothetical protein